jgi:alpha-tubulin suppressor-like RCC1 family protein
MRGGRVSLSLAICAMLAGLSLSVSMPRPALATSPQWPVSAAVSPNVQIPSGTDTNTYAETTVAYDPTNHSNLFAGSNIETLASMSAFRSANSGTTWTAATANPAPVTSPNNTTADPAAAFDSNGALYYAFIGQDASPSTLQQLVVSKSTDKGANWVAPIQVEQATNKPDRPSITDLTLAAFPNRLVLAYDNQLGLDPQGIWHQPVVVAHYDTSSSFVSTNWTKQSIYDGGGDISSMPATDSNGNIYVVWDDFCGGEDSTGHCLNPSGRVLLAKSADGGTTFTALGQSPRVVASTSVGFGATLPSFSSSSCPLPPGQRKVGVNPGLAIDRSGGAHNGEAYIIWADEQPLGNHMHVYFSRSGDGGSSWSSPVRVDPGNVNDAFEPAISVDQSTGVVSVAWYDLRDDPANGIFRVYYTESWDGGSTFLPIQAAVSTIQGDARRDCFGVGDYMGLTSVDRVAHIVWTDNRNGNNQTFTAAVKEGSLAGCFTTPISAGDQSVLAISSVDGSVWAWGANTDGQLGDGTTTNRSLPVEVHGLGGSGFLTSIVSVGDADGDHALALGSDGSVYAWGLNIYGQLGDGTTTQRLTPVRVVGVGGRGFLTSIVAIAAGSLNSYALASNGTVYSWGDNSAGELGNGNSRVTTSTTPVQVVSSTGKGSLTGIASISAGGSSTGQGQVLALSSADGSIWAWGANYSGELGNGTTTNSYTPIKVVGVGGSGLMTGVQWVGAGAFHSLAVKSGGTAFAWGEGVYGKLGNGGTANSSTPVQVSTISSGSLVGGGSEFSLAVTSDRTAWAWGFNRDGELGNNSTSNSLTPVTVYGPLTVTAVAGGSYDSVGLKADGSAWDWGLNNVGELGTGPANVGIPSSIPVQVSNLPLVTQPGSCP